MPVKKKVVKKVKLPVQDEKTENTWAMLCHLSTFSGFFIPLGNVVAPLILWSLQKYDYALVDDQGKEALNFQISIVIYFLVSAVFSLILIGLLIMLVLVVFDIIVTIAASISASDGKQYRYPLNLRLIK